MSSLTAWRTSKARDTYGPIVELVKKQQEVAKKTGLPASYAGTNLAITNKPGQNKSNIITNAYGSTYLYYSSEVDFLYAT